MVSLYGLEGEGFRVYGLGLGGIYLGCIGICRGYYIKTRYMENQMESQLETAGL